MKSGALWHRFLAYHLGGAVAAAWLSACGSSGSAIGGDGGGTTVDASVHADAAVQDATNSSDSEAGSPPSEAGAMAPTDAGAPDAVAGDAVADGDAAAAVDAGPGDAAGIPDSGADGEAGADGSVKKIELICRIDTVDELEYFRHGGILPYVLRNLAAS